MKTVAVTGASGYLGRKVLERLGSDAEVSRVIGIDIVEPSFSTRNLEFYRLDVRSSDIQEVIAGCDVIVHLAFVQSGRHADEMQDVNVGGTRRVFEAAETAGVRKVIYASDAIVYGAHPDNAYPLSEESAVRPNPQLPYAQQKADTEDIAEAFARAHPETVVTILRPCLVAGPAVAGPSARLVESPVGVIVDGYDPPVQVLHEDDFAAAVSLAMSRDLTGTYNVTPDDDLRLSDALRRLRQRQLTLDASRARRRFEQLWRARLSELHPADVDYLMYPVVATNDRLKALGFSPAHSTRDALDDAARARRGWVAIGTVRFRPRRVALVVGSLGLAVVGSAARSAIGRRSRRETG